MTAILSAAAVKFSVLADGTPRATIDFAPGDAKLAFDLCGTPGQPLGVAKLAVGHAAAKEEKADPRGPLCMDAISLCNNSDFQRFASMNLMWECDEIGAKGYILKTCGITSRKELDSNPIAATKLRELVLRYRGWLQHEHPQ